jgi:hypothetical protein
MVRIRFPPALSPLRISFSGGKRGKATATNFRRAFAEIYRSKALLFLGSGMNETYFHNLFDEIVQLYGNCAHLHHAVIKKGTVSDIKGFERLLAPRS